MNYPELIWRLIEIVLKEKEPSQEIDEEKKNKLNTKEHDETE